MIYYAISGLLSVLIRAILSKNEEIPRRNIVEVGPLREDEQQVSNNEILLVLNSLTTTVQNINTKVDNNHREIQYEMKKSNSIIDVRLQILEQKEVSLKVIDLD